MQQSRCVSLTTWAGWWCECVSHASSNVSLCLTASHMRLTTWAGWWCECVSHASHCVSLRLRTWAGWWCECVSQRGRIGGVNVSHMRLTTWVGWWCECVSLRLTTWAGWWCAGTESRPLGDGLHNGAGHCKIHALMSGCVCEFTLHKCA